MISVAKSYMKLCTTISEPKSHRYLLRNNPSARTCTKLEKLAKEAQPAAIHQLQPRSSLKEKRPQPLSTCQVTAIMQRTFPPCTMPSECPSAVLFIVMSRSRTWTWLSTRSFGMPSVHFNTVRSRTRTSCRSISGKRVRAGWWFGLDKRCSRDTSTSYGFSVVAWRRQRTWCWWFWGNPTSMRLVPSQCSYWAVMYGPGLLKLAMLKRMSRRYVPIVRMHPAT